MSWNTAPALEIETMENESKIQRRGLCDFITTLSFFPIDLTT
tara:strand:- start:235 stop:360 length:126 start_codon:yes stop_codon:yes gene_type:complete